MRGDGTEDILTEGLPRVVFALVDRPLNRLAPIALVQQAIECHRLRQEVAELRRTLRESGVKWGRLMGLGRRDRGSLSAAPAVLMAHFPVRAKLLVARPSGG